MKLHTVARILVVDDDPVWLGIVSTALANAGYDTIEANSGEAALGVLAKLAAHELPEIILLDIEMWEGIDGFEVCRRVKANPITCDIPVIFLTGRLEPAYEQLAFAIGAVDYISKPASTHMILAHVRTHMMLRAAAHVMDERNNYLAHQVALRTEELQSNIEELRVSQEVTLVALASLAQARDNETGNHLFRTQHYVRALANHLRGHTRYATELDDAMVDRLFKAAPLHDAGKVGIPDRILLKPGRLTAQEFEIMKTHTTIGRDAIEKAQRRVGVRVPLLETAMEIAHSHQEKWDGSGYPQGLVGDAIPLSARLMAVADVYDALISRRVYKSAIPHAQARAIIAAGRGQHFDPDIVDAFLSMESEFQEIALRYADQVDAFAPVDAQLELSL
jgi:putative two-component system response regulator